MKKQSIPLIVYGVLNIAGGLFGYLKAHSLPSLFGGIGIGLILSFLGWRLYRGEKKFFYPALGVVLFAILVFSFRFFRSTHFFPAGVMMLLGVLTCLLLFDFQKIKSYLK